MLALSGIGAIVAPIAATVSCGANVDKLDPSKKDSVVMVVGSVGHEDKGFLQGAYDGAQKIIKSKIGLENYRQVKIPTSSIPDAKKGATSAILAGGYTILGVGYQYPTFFNGKDYAGKYKDRVFIGIDGTTVDSSFKPLAKLLDNVINVAFKAEQSSFLAGVSAGLYLAAHYDTYKDGGLKVGSYGGSAYSTVTDMIVGFMRGIAFYNDKLAKDDSHKVEFIGWNGSSNGFADGFAPSPAGTAKSKALISKGADVIFPVAGGQVSTTVDAIKSTPGSKVKLIGVDSDQNKVFGKDGNIFITSSMKDTSRATEEALKAVYKKPSLVKMGMNNFVGLAGGFLRLAEGQIASIKGKSLKDLIKADGGFNITSDDSVYAQLSSSTSDIYKAATSFTDPGAAWTKVKESIFGAKDSKVPSLTNF